jgi:hypothetical protein
MKWQKNSTNDLEKLIKRENIKMLCNIKKLIMCGNNFSIINLVSIVKIILENYKSKLFGCWHLIFYF